MAQTNHKSVRQKIEAMSAEVVDSNPYSRLMALKKMGIVKNYEVSIVQKFTLRIFETSQL